MGTKEQNEEYATALDALHKNCEKQRKAGIDWENDENNAAQDRVREAEQHVSRWQRIRHGR